MMPAGFSSSKCKHQLYSKRCNSGRQLIVFIVSLSFFSSYKLEIKQKVKSVEQSTEKKSINLIVK